MGLNVNNFPGGAATKEFFFPANAGTEKSTINGFFCTYRINAAGETAVITMLVPRDFQGISESVVVCTRVSNLAMKVDLATNYGTIDEDYDTHSETDNDVDVPAGAAKDFEEIDISGVLSGIAAGDIVGLKVTADNVDVPDIYIFGIRFRYY